MTIATTYPGVYIKELSSGVRTITNVSTSITAFVGYTAAGIDHVPTTVLSFADYERRFGGLAKKSELSYSIKHFFDNGGSQAIVVKVPSSDAVSASVTLKDKVGGKDVLKLTAISKGEWGNNIAVDVDYYSVSPKDSKTFNMTVTDLATGKVERFLNLSMTNSTRNVESVINDVDQGSSLVRVNLLNQDLNRPAETGTVSDGDVDLQSLRKLSAGIYDLKVSFSNMDAFALKDSASTNTNHVVFTNELPIVATSIGSLCRQLEANVNQKLAALIDGVMIRCLPSSSGKGLRVLADIDPQRYKDYSPYDNIVTFNPGESDKQNNYGLCKNLKLGTPLKNENVARYRLGVGSSAGAQSNKVLGTNGSTLPGTSDLIGKDFDKSGLQALNSVDVFNLLCIPDATRTNPKDRNQIDSGVSPLVIFSAAAEICEKKRAFLIVDPTPDVSEPKAAITWNTSVQKSIRGSNSAAYFPRIEVPDPLNDYKTRIHPPCGVIAGLYSRTDAERGVWKAPAGTDASLRGVQDLTYKLDDKENGELNLVGINCLRKLPTYGSVAWGTRTILGADALSSEWKYIPVRRLALFIEESLYRGTQWIVFEPNDEPLWSQIRLNIGAFMQSLYRQGAFAGKSPRDAYEVRCDKSTTTPDDINRGIVNILVKFKPLYPAEFVVIKIQQMAGQTMV
jgi:uncharacterized protein